MLTLVKRKLITFYSKNKDNFWSFEVIFKKCLDGYKWVFIYLREIKFFPLGSFIYKQQSFQNLKRWNLLVLKYSTRKDCSELMQWNVKWKNENFFFLLKPSERLKFFPLVHKLFSYLDNWNDDQIYCEITTKFWHHLKLLKK